MFCRTFVKRIEVLLVSISFWTCKVDVMGLDLNLDKFEIKMDAIRFLWQWLQAYIQPGWIVFFNKYGQWGPRVGDIIVKWEVYHSLSASGTKSPTAAADSDWSITIGNLSEKLTALFHDMCIVLSLIALSSEAAKATTASASHLLEKWWNGLFGVLANLDQWASVLSILHGVNKGDGKTFLALSCCSSDSL